MIPFERKVLDYYRIDADNQCATQAFATIANDEALFPVIDVLMKTTVPLEAEMSKYLQGTAWR